MDDPDQIELADTTKRVEALLMEGRADVALGVAEILYSTGDELDLEASREGLVSRAIMHLEGRILEKPNHSHRAMRWLQSDRSGPLIVKVFGFAQTPPPDPPREKLLSTDRRLLAEFATWLRQADELALLATLNFVYFDKVEPQHCGAPPESICLNILSSLRLATERHPAPLRKHLTGLLVGLGAESKGEGDVIAPPDHLLGNSMVRKTGAAASQLQNHRMDWRAKGLSGYKLYEMASRVDDFLSEGRADVALRVSAMLYSAHGPTVGDMTVDALRRHMKEKVRGHLRKGLPQPLRSGLLELMYGPDNSRNPGVRPTRLPAKPDHSRMSDEEIAERFNHLIAEEQPSSLLSAVNLLFLDSTEPVEDGRMPTRFRRELTGALRRLTWGWQARGLVKRSRRLGAGTHHRARSSPSPAAPCE